MTGMAFEGDVPALARTGLRGRGMSWYAETVLAARSVSAVRHRVDAGTTTMKNFGSSGNIGDSGPRHLPQTKGVRIIRMERMLRIASSAARDGSREAGDSGALACTITALRPRLSSPGRHGIDPFHPYHPYHPHPLRLSGQPGPTRNAASPIFPEEPEFLILASALTSRAELGP